MLTVGTIWQERYQIDTLEHQEETEFIYHGLDTQTNRSIIIQEFIPQSNLTAENLAELKKQLAQEAQALTKLEHQYLAPMPAFFEVEDKAYLITEIVEGETLDARIDRAGSLLEAQVVTWTAHILTVLHYCHHHNVFHRNITPKSIIIRPDERAVLSGFGLVKLKANPSQQATNPLIGAAPFAPLEQYSPRLLTKANPSNDIYSLGAVMYYALTNTLPPPANKRIDFQSSAAALYKSLMGDKLSDERNERHAESITIQDKNPLVSMNTEAIINRAMQVNRQDRYPNAKSMLKEIVPKKKGGAIWAVALISLILILILAGGLWWAFLPPSQSTLTANETSQAGSITNEIAATETALAADAIYGAEEATSVAAVEAGVDGIAATETALAIEADAVSAGATEVAAKAATIAVESTEIAATQNAPTVTPIPSDTPIPTPTPTEIFASLINPNIPEEMIDLRDTDNMVMVYVTAGDFIMGSQPGQGDPSEGPQHVVTLDAFWIDGHEVTNSQFAAFLNQAGNQAEGGVTWLKTGSDVTQLQEIDGVWTIPDPAYTNHPVTGATWYGAQAYCQWHGARLPTEAEWEKAARGSDNFIYPWGNESPDCSRINHGEGNSCVGGTSAVGSYPTGSSPYGALDMAGNVWEWVEDWYENDYYTRSPNLNPTGPNSGAMKVLRGGSWFDLPVFARTAFRGFANPAATNDKVGFRCVQD